jgi:hypothetical protein
MARGVEVLCRVLVLRAITTADVTAFETLAQMNPRVTRLEAILAALGAGRYVVNVAEVRAMCHVDTDPVFAPAS